MNFIDIQGLPKLREDIRPPEGTPLFRLGFRFFFFAAALWSILTLGLWVLMYSGVIDFPHHFMPMQWHGREMVFGFTAAVIAGFLLTAAGNWTGLPMPSGKALQGFALLWTAGRLLPLVPVIPMPITGFVDVSFFVALAATLSLPLWKAKQVRNYPFPVLLLGLGVANFLSYTQMRNAQGLAVGTELGIVICLAVVMLMGGRVIPGFTRGRIQHARTRTFLWVEKGVIGLFVIAAVAELSALPPQLWGSLFLLAGIVNAIRLAGWFTPEISKQPLLWILHVAYFWLVFGLILKGWAGLGWGNILLARHALTAGALGSICLGMMTRVTLGHTGRAMQIPPIAVVSFGLIQLTALCRVVLPLLHPRSYLLGIQLSVVFWIAAFGIYLWVYGPMLFRARADGERG
ncbi:NnrS family protein [Kiritimatiellaeota bacterium B1221]|nr:NnrS family protein [Kiritimatiellaeota bacterium B1221]